jgi:hypothetical protein
LLNGAKAGAEITAEAADAKGILQLEVDSHIGSIPVRMDAHRDKPQ